MSLTNYYELLILNDAIGCANDTTWPATQYVGLSTTLPTEAGANVTEPTETGSGAGEYARKSITSSTFAAAASGSITTTADITFASADGDDWASGADLAYAVVYDAATSGNLLYWGALDTAKPVLDGDTPRILTGNLTITLD